MQKDYNGKFSPLSIAALVCSVICCGIVGVILGIIDLTKKDGRRRELSIIAIVLGIVLPIIGFAVFGRGNKGELKDSATEQIETSSSTSSIMQTENSEEEVSDVMEDTPIDKDKDSDSITDELSEKYGLIGPDEFVKGDSTGKWKITKLADSTPTADFAVEYANAFMTDNDIHFIVNFTLKTTSMLKLYNGTLEVRTTEYVEKEEHDASKIGGGMLYTDQYFDVVTGEEITTEGDLSAGTVDEEELISSVKEAIDGSVGEKEKITDVKFDGTDLKVVVDLSEADTSILSAKEIAESRISSITDSILALEDKYYNTWETVTIDFGEEGKATLDKSMVKDQGYGKFFEVPMGILN